MISIDDVKIACYTLAVIVAWTVAAFVTPAVATAITLPVCVALVLPCALHLRRRRSRQKRGRTRAA